MSKKSQQDIVDAYLLHRECVRRNAEYAEAYRQVAALTHPAQHEFELVKLAERWGLALTDDLPDPSACPGYDPKQLRSEAHLSLATLQDGPMQTDPIEMDAALTAQEYLSTVGAPLSQELKGFLVLLHCPETTDRPWGFDVIDLRRPKEEILAGIQHLIDEAREQEKPRSTKLRGPSGSGLKAKGFDYLKVYDLKQRGKSFKWIAYEMWELILRPTISLDTPLGHTVPIIDGDVHGEIENRARPVFLAQEDGGGAARAAWRRSRCGLAGSRDHRR
ncbi:MAG: DUF6499 domain-containing protein, partial [Nitrospira sp.]